MIETKLNNIFGEVHETELVLLGQITIENIGLFDFHPRDVEPIRQDIFQPNHFSVFDTLLTLAEKGKISLDYHFEEFMGMYVIDSINGKKNWWYRACYHQGNPAQMQPPRCREINIMPMDQYPYKDKMVIIFYQVPEEDLNIRYNAFRIETERRKASNGRVIIPIFSIKGQTENMNFENVEVKPHNIRGDMFKEGVVTAIDSIMTLGDEKRLTYDLTWREKIGETEIKGYYVTRINEDKSFGRCGFVYECGAYPEYRAFSGNAIHVTADIRILNSPTYMEFMWNCIEPTRIFLQRPRIMEAYGKEGKPIKRLI